MPKRPWEDFKNVASQSFTPHLVSQAAPVLFSDLVDMASYKQEERKKACGGIDPLRILLAYAQEELVYDPQGNMTAADKAIYGSTPRNKRVNVFGLAYRREAKFWLHRVLADIVVGAAIRLYKTQRWTTALYDGLRTVEGAYKLYQFATDEDIAARLLALPGQSAHNKGMAVDSMMYDIDGKEVDMGGHFDHLDMSTNNRAYTGSHISEKAKKNRRIREAAFLYSAFTQGLLVAPLRSEFWDDRLPENCEDLWRVLDSAARAAGMTLYTEDDTKLRMADRAAWKTKWESWSYADFCERWRALFRGREDDCIGLFGVAEPPTLEKIEFYHGNFHPIYDRDLKQCGKHLT